jgi:hypothetical protein
VVYQANWPAGGDNYTTLKDAYFSNGVLNFSAQVINDVRIANCTCMTDTISHSFLITAEPSSIRPMANLTRIAITYTITHLSNATGFYDHFLVPRILLSVSHSASQISASDFPYANTVKPGGPVQAYVPISVYVTGADVSYVTYTTAAYP